MGAGVGVVPVVGLGSGSGAGAGGGLDRTLSVRATACPTIPTKPEGLSSRFIENLTHAEPKPVFAVLTRASESGSLMTI